MSADLTRWNRGGRSRFDYIDGNAVNWAELLRAALRERFPDWQAVEDSAPPDESDVERLARLVRQYEGTERGDLLWEITRALARSGHVLTGYIDAYANEGYLRTATQWDNVRRLVDMIDYHPAPPASAYTRLVLVAKDEESGQVDAGFQVKYTPPDGNPPVIFETLEPIVVDAALNAVRLAGWNRSALTLAATSGPVWLADSGSDDLSAGQLALLVRSGDSEDAAVMELQSVDSSSGEIAFLPHSGQPATSAWPLADLTLEARATQIHTVLSSEANAVRLSVSHGLAVGDVVTWRSGASWRFNRVAATDRQSISLDFDSPLPVVGTGVYKAAVIERQGGTLLFAVDSAATRVTYLSGTQFTFLSFGNNGNYVVADEDEDFGTFYQVTDGSINRLFVAPDRSEVDAIATTVAVDEEAYEIGGNPGELASGQWVVAQGAGSTGYRAALIERIEVREDRFFLTLEGVSPVDTTVERVFGNFRHSIEPVGANDNTTALTGSALSVLTVDAGASATLSAQLVVGRQLVIEQDTGSGYDNAVVATVTKVDGAAITIEPALDASRGFTTGNTVIRGNVVLAGHGERQPQRVLGSGDATRINQGFDFKNAGVSFVADSTMSAGVRADIAVTVGGKTWTQVSVLNDSGATDTHYTVRMTQDDFLRVAFGDGVHGRRLPTGTGNVRIGWRKGGGLAGNLKPGSLAKPVKPHRLLDSVRQPLDTTGGADTESADALRTTAPATLLTLERAVSVSDFKYLAAGLSSVWQASAFTGNAAFSRNDRIEVVVVPSGGGSLGDLRGSLESFLQNHALPGVTVTVSGYEAVVVELRITVRIDSAAFDPDAVTAAVVTEIVKAFSLEVRQLGQALNLAEVFEVVENVQGVSNSDCTIVPLNEQAVLPASEPVRPRLGAGGIIKSLRPNARQVIHVADDGLGVTVAWQEHTL